MEQLSSCYFCGGALDASLDEYPVVPKALRPTEDDQKTVVLCQGCRQKLGTVVETIVDVFDQETLDERDAATGNVGAGDAAAGGASAGGAAAGDAADSSAGGDPLEDEGWVDAGELASQNDADDASAGDAADAGAQTSTDDDPKDVTYTTSTAAGGRKSVAGNPESIREEREASNGGDSGSGATNDADGATDAGDDGGTDADDGPSLTALENTKVMRLLQNREFPVDRAEIKTVAVNAYDMDESRFDKVVDAAVEKGLIGEENGQFVETT